MEGGFSLVRGDEENGADFFLGDKRDHSDRIVDSPEWTWSFSASSLAWSLSRWRCSDDEVVRDLLVGETSREAPAEDEPPDVFLCRGRTKFSCLTPPGEFMGRPFGDGVNRVGSVAIIAWISGAAHECLCGRDSLGVAPLD